MGASNNPPAFPQPYAEEGMSLRDWFAGQLAAAEVASAGANVDAAEALADAASRAGQTIPERIAFNAYEVADAMLVAREPVVHAREPVVHAREPVVHARSPAVAPQPGMASCGHPINSFECVECAPF